MSYIIHPNNNLVNSSEVLSPERSKVKSKGPKIIFMGTPEFSLPILEKLAQSEYKPAAIFCAPDKPVGRKQILTPPPTKILAQKHNIPVFQPANSRELDHTIKTIPHDLIITAAYGLILPKEVLDTPKYGCLNIHPSLLPKYRGPSPIQSAILNGDAETGVTIYKMDEQIDHGPIIAQEKILLNSVIARERSDRDNPVEGDTNTGLLRGVYPVYVYGARNDAPITPGLSKKLAELGAELLLKALPDWLAGQITPQPQDNSQATLTKIITKEDGQIDWRESAAEIERQIRAYIPWPGAYTYYSLSKAAGRVEKSKIKILTADATDKNYGTQNGQIFLTDDNDLAVQTGSGALIIKKLQLSGGKFLSAPDFFRGHKEIIGKILK
ncbi:methionyl-tRNA formyltransferase [Patescibacteria group bacterium]|nr:methionyl-tRNA formyltransferase [Patescibacteria group bacterium]